jgi:CRP-like cAMP-binding protein
VPLTEGQIQKLVAVAWKEYVTKDAIVMLEGDLNNTTFYIVQKGSFEVSSSAEFELCTLKGDLNYVSRPEQPPVPKEDFQRVQKPKTVRTLIARSMVGDSSMYYGTPRWTSVIALEDSEVWVISQADFKTVQQEGATDKTKTDADKNFIMEVLKHNENLQRLTPLTSRHLTELAGVAWKKTVEKDTVFMQEGDLNADAFYIIADGAWEFSGSEPFSRVEAAPKEAPGVSYLSRAAHTGQALESSGEKKNRGLFGRGLCFGEISMLYCAPRFATVVAKERGYMWAVDRSNFQMVQMKAAEDELKARVKYLNALQTLESFSKDDKEKLAAAMENMRFTQGEEILSQGKQGKTLYILMKGTVVVKSKDEPDKKLTAMPDQVLYFGEQALSATSKAVSKETVVFESPTGCGLVMEREEFHKIWDRLIEARPCQAFTRYATSATKAPSEHGKLFAIDNQNKIGTIGYGSFGAVELCQNMVSKDLYVMKTLNKGLIVQKGYRKSIMRERMLWNEVVSPFIVRVFATYNQPQYLSFLVEAALGGELSRIYQKYSFYGSEKHTRYYVAGVVLALEHLHKRRIIYRSVQPSNILLSTAGQPKLTDMALAKLIVGHTFTVCGTPTYMAPEVLAGIGHTRAVDWWAVGVLIFELMSGRSPFESDHPMEIYSNVMRGFARVELPGACQGLVGELIGACLQHKGIDRLPMRQGGVQNMFSHGWFEQFDWNGMRMNTLAPPYVPTWATQPNEWKELSPSKADMYLTHFRPMRNTFAPAPVEYDEFADEENHGWDDEFETVVGGE